MCNNNDNNDDNNNNNNNNGTFCRYHFTLIAKESYEKRATTLGEVTSILLRSYRVTGSSRYTHATSLAVRIVSEFPPVIGHCPDHRNEREATIGPKFSGLPMDYVVSTRMGNPSLSFSGYQYRNHRKNSKLINWVCIKDKCGKCKGKLKTTLQHEIVSQESTVALQTWLEFRLK